MAAKRKSRSNSASATTKKAKKQAVEQNLEAEESEFMEEPEIMNNSSDVSMKEEDEQEEVNWLPKPRARSKNPNGEEYEGECLFTSQPVPDEEARTKWPHRYSKKMNKKVGAPKIVKSNDNEEEEPIPALCHFTQAKVDGQIYNLYDDAYVTANAGEDPYICKIVELFESEDGSFHFNAQWFYRAKDTVIGECDDLIDEKCIFFSEVKDDNPLNCLLRKLNIVKLSSKTDLEYKKNVRDACDYYYEMMYLLPYTSFVSLSNDGTTHGNEMNLSASSDSDGAVETSEAASLEERADMVLMDIYSGCGAMSTGLCLGASRGGVKLTTAYPTVCIPRGWPPREAYYP